jgi:hypothetical protein
VGIRVTYLGNSDYDLLGEDEDDEEEEFDNEENED